MKQEYSIFVMLFCFALILFSISFILVSNTLNERINWSFMAIIFSLATYYYYIRIINRDQYVFKSERINE